MLFLLLAKNIPAHLSENVHWVLLTSHLENLKIRSRKPSYTNNLSLSKPTSEGSLWLWSQRCVRSQNSWGVRKHHSTSPAYQLPKGSPQSLPFPPPHPQAPAPSHCSGQLYRQRAPSTFPSTALPAPSSSSPLHPRPSSALHPNAHTQHPPTGTRGLSQLPLGHLLPIPFPSSAPQSAILPLCPSGIKPPTNPGYFFPGTAHSPLPSSLLCVPRDRPGSGHFPPAPQRQNFYFPGRGATGGARGWGEVWAPPAPEVRSL